MTDRTPAETAFFNKFIELALDGGTYEPLAKWVMEQQRAAVAANTERCAKIAKEFLSLPDEPCVTVEAVKTAIAAAIREGEE